MRKVLWLTSQLRRPANMPMSPQDLKAKVTGSRSVVTATLRLIPTGCFWRGRDKSVQITCKSPEMNGPFHCLLLSSLFCREMEEATKERFITMSPSSSCFLVPCLTSLKRAELSTQLSRCLRQVILFPLVFWSNSKPDKRVMSCSPGETAPSS